ncbi:mobile mystery protein B [Cedecea davisae]|uniref:Mobile mystery protein B n=1 Tax=Cedecea davisae TaxID=158484 RepID=A0ABS6DKH2_9ENTR|nr:mobile mystery protein B [Cedecea davisae]MBU4683720.1 mobile mystery protein B [Cedecea davisae]MBU4687095.1 mobile mystery protein B [Cedecea davisae]
MNDDINGHLPEGATALSPDDLAGLIPDYITTRNALNEFEKINIQQALLWLSQRRISYERILTLEFCRRLHRAMFSQTWEWAGRFRQHEVNIGNTAPYMISTRLQETFDNVRYWIENRIFHLDEITLRLHRDIVWIHPFPNGNGRHSRIYCDVLRKALGLPRLRWGENKTNLAESNLQRTQYIKALREADQGRYESLLKFAR